MTIENDAIPRDATTTKGFASDEDAVTALSKFFGDSDAQKPSTRSERETEQETAEEETADDADHDGSDGNEVEEESPSEDRDDDSEHDSEQHDDDRERERSYKFDGKEIKYRLKDAEQAMGERAAITRKSQEVAELRKAASTERDKYMTSAKKLLDEAIEEYKPYAEINWPLLATKIPTQEITQDRYLQWQATAKRAYDKVNYLTSEVETIAKTVEQERTTAVRRAWAEAETAIKNDIPTFTGETAREIREHALRNGIPAEILSMAYDVNVIKYLYKNMLAEKGNSVTTKPTNKTPKFAKTTRAPETASKKTGPETKLVQAKQRFAKTRSDADAQAVFENIFKTQRSRS